MYETVSTTQDLGRRFEEDLKKLKDFLEENLAPAKIEYEEKTKLVKELYQLKHFELVDYYDRARVRLKKGKKNV